MKKKVIPTENGEDMPEVRNWKWGVPNPRNRANDAASLS